MDNGKILGDEDLGIENGEEARKVSGEDEDIEVWVVDDEAEEGEQDAPEVAPPLGDGSELDTLRRELAQAKDQWLRTVADLDNYRKRAEREARDSRRYALYEPMRDLLAVVDNLERALAAPGSVEDLKQGVEMILSQLKDYLRKQGVETVEAVGAPFDPNLHDAVSRHESTEHDEPTVADELQKGYRLHERLLRPALVTVAMPAKES